MNIAVVSDSHNHLPNCRKAVKIANQHHCGYLLHLGDFTDVAAAACFADFSGQIVAVYGNCDHQHFALKEVLTGFGGFITQPPFLLELANKRILLNHIPGSLFHACKYYQADYYFYGHLHQADFRQAEGMVVLNPGELTDRKGQSSLYICNLNTNDFEKIELALD
jgi:putative phosphoesterase